MQEKKSNESRPTDRRERNVGLRRHRVARTFEMGPLMTHSVMNVTKVALRFLKRGTVVRAEVPYAEGAGSKIRPAVVVGCSGNDVELIALTSSKRAVTPTDVPLEDLEAAGVYKPTTARTGRHVLVDRVSVIHVLGHLSDTDLAHIFVVDGEAA